MTESANEQKTLTDKLTKTPEGRKLYQQERAILEITQLICQLMVTGDVSRAELAKRLGTTMSAVTLMLDGRANMTVRKISDVMGALGRSLHFCCDRIDVEAWIAVDYVTSQRGNVKPKKRARANDGN